MERFEFCYGNDCPIKKTCLRYKEKIVPTKEFHFGFVPYDFKRERCGHWIGKHGENILNQIEDIKRDLENEN